MDSSFRLLFALKYLPPVVCAISVSVFRLFLHPPFHMIYAQIRPSQERELFRLFQFQWYTPAHQTLLQSLQQ